MKIKHLKNLIVFEDGRGKICDLVYPANITHVGFISSVAKSIRGNHYHKLTTQHIFIIKGKLKYWYKNQEDTKGEFIVGTVGDLITSSPWEIHAMQMLEDTDFIVMAEGPRAGEEYESDTYRVETIVK